MTIIRRGWMNLGYAGLLIISVCLLCYIAGFLPFKPSWKSPGGKGDADDTFVDIPALKTSQQYTHRELALLYHRYINTPQILCHRIVRIGSLGDGGWEICDDTAFRPLSPCLVYSFGINNDFSFDDHMAQRYNCEVHSFDPSMKLPEGRRDQAGDLCRTSTLFSHSRQTKSITMADVAAPAPAKAKKAAKPKKPAAHPKYSEMIAAAVGALKERGGSSRQAILKYIQANYKVGDNGVAVNARLKLALKAGCKSGALKQAKGTGASGSFKLGEVKKVVKKAKKPKAAKPKKAKTPKKKVAKKPAAKKTPTKKAAAKKPVKAEKAKTPKKAAKPAAKKAAKSPKKAKAAMPKKTKTPKKAAKK